MLVVKCGLAPFINSCRLLKCVTGTVSTDCYPALLDDQSAHQPAIDADLWKQKKEVFHWNQPSTQMREINSNRHRFLFHFAFLIGCLAAWLLGGSLNNASIVKFYSFYSRKIVLIHFNSIIFFNDTFFSIENVGFTTWWMIFAGGLMMDPKWHANDMQMICKCWWRVTPPGLATLPHHQYLLLLILLLSTSLNPWRNRRQNSTCALQFKSTRKKIGRIN